MDSRERTRRRVLRSLGLGSLLGLTGCVELAQFADEENTGGSATPAGTDTGTPPGSTSAPAGSPTEGPGAGTGEATGTAEGTGTGAGTRDAPGYKDYHWHGRLFFEIDGDLVDFDRPKYYLDNLQQERPDTVYFHFHEGDAHGPNEWSNEKKVVTFARALNLLPGISYERGAGHAVTYDGTTYRSSAAGTKINIYRDTEPIDPTEYEVQHDDNYWVGIDTGRGASSTGSAARSGKLIVDVNNRRLDLSGATSGSGAIEFRDDPYTWYADGQVTLAEALNAIPDVTFETQGGSPVVKYSATDELGGVYRGSESGTEILTRQRWNDVGPEYTLMDGDILWVYVHTDKAPDNEH